MKKMVKFLSILAILFGVASCACDGCDDPIGNSSYASIPNYPSSSSISNNSVPIINSTNSTNSSSSSVVIEEHMVTFNYDWYVYSNMALSTENGYIEKPEDPTRENYIFSGWYLGEGLFDFNSLVTEDITLVARWSLLHSVVFNYNYTHEIKREILTTTDYIEEPETPVMEGYLFDGWYNREGLFDFSQLITGYTVLNAKWIVIPTELEFCYYSSFSSSKITDGLALTEYNGYSQSIYIPTFVTEIKSDVFKNGNFKYVFYAGSLEDWGAIVFENEYSNPMCTAERLYILNDDDKWERVY